MKVKAPTVPEPAPGLAPLALPHRLGYLPGIDGLRGLSVLAVVAYHLDAAWAAGGYLGVEVFFVVSGFLITGLLLQERDTTGHVDLIAFWRRRARRLLPAVLVLLAAVTAWGALVYPEGELARFRGDVVSSLLYVQNWWAIVADQPYFAVFGRPSPLRHLWSLAIEEQFYLLWPLVLPWSLRHLGRRRTALVMAALTVASAATMAAAADIAAPERAYYGTDTRLSGLLLGGLLAFVWRPSRANATISRRARTVLDALGGAGLVALGWQLATRSEYDPWTYPWGFLVVDVATIVLIVTSTHPAGRLGAWVGSGPLQVLGRRSYSIYLWHWPVIVSTRPGQDWGLDGPAVLAARLVLVALLSEISYRMVEQPVRDGRAAAAIRRLRRAMAQGVPGRGQMRTLVALSATTAVLTVATMGALLATAPWAQRVEAAVGTGDAPATLRIDLDPVRERPLTTTSTTRPPAASPATPATPSPTPSLAPTPATTPATPSTGAPPASPPSTEAQAPTTGPEPAFEPTAAPITDPARPGRSIEVTVVGESVTLGGARAIQDHYGGRVQIDADQGRRFAEGVEVVEALARAGRLTPTVVVHLGNNGVAPAGALDRVVAAAGPERRVVLVSVRVPRRWQEQVNGEIWRVVQAHPQVVLADWHRITATEEGLLTDDGVHLTYQGQRRYRDMLVELVP